MSALKHGACELNIIEAARGLLARGWMPLPVRDGKNPGFDKWQDFETTAEDLPMHFGNGCQLGVLLGRRSKWLAEVDLDCVEAVRLADRFLPPTRMISGRMQSPRSHIWYISEFLVTAKFQDPEKPEAGGRSMIVELRGTGAQTLVHPSLHPSGDTYVWDGDLDPAAVNQADLRRAVGRLAACVLISRRWDAGRRHDIALALAGGLLRAGWPVKDIEHFILSAAGVAGDDDPKDRCRAAADTAKNIAQGRKATGLPTLAALVGEKVVARMREWLELPEGFVDAVGSDPGDRKNTRGWPDPSPLPDGLRPVPKLTLGDLPERLRPWLSDIAERMQCPLEYPAVAAIIGAAAVIGNKVVIRPKRYDRWAVVPNLWGGVVGPPSVLKTPSVAEALAPVFLLVERARAAYQRADEDWRSRADDREMKGKVLKKKIEDAYKKNLGADVGAYREQIRQLDAGRPVERRYVVNDTTAEKLILLLGENPNGLLQYRDELTGWLKSMEKPGREGDRALYLEMWDGGGSGGGPGAGYVSDRIVRGTNRSDNLTLSLLGSIPPGPLSAYLRACAEGSTGDDGLIQRLQLLVYPDPPRVWANCDRAPAPRADVEEAYLFLDSMKAGEVGAAEVAGGFSYVHFSDQAQDFFDAWRSDLEAELIRMQTDDHPALAAHLGKYRSLMPSLALIFQLFDGPGSCVGGVGLEAARLAAAWCSFLFEHARRVHGFIFDADVIAARSLARHISRGALPDPFTRRQVAQKGWSGLTSVRDLSGPLEILTHLNWIWPATIRSGEQGGRPKTEYFINPKAKGRGQ